MSDWLTDWLSDEAVTRDAYASKKYCKYKEGWCSYLDNCWFIHENLSSENDENNEKDKNENNEDMVKRLFDIVKNLPKKS